MLNFALRNLVLFFKDKTAVVLSFLAEFIVVGLYILFMRDNLIGGFAGVTDVEPLLDAWMIAGLMGITPLTTTMGAYAIMVEDKAKKIARDFMTSPMHKSSLFTGYMLSAVIIGTCMSLLLLGLSAVYMYVCHEANLFVTDMVDLLYVMGMNTLASASLVLFLVSFIKTSNALAACCTIMGALIGFLTGIYLPVGSLPEGVGTLVKCFPISHGVALFRRILTEPFLEGSFGSMQSEGAVQFAEYMGVRYYFDGQIFDEKNSLLLLMGTVVVFLAVTVFCRREMNDHGFDELWKKIFDR